MNEFPGEENEYVSVDSAMSDGEVVQYTVEFLNSLELTGMPSHILKLKMGSPSCTTVAISLTHNNKTTFVILTLWIPIGSTVESSENVSPHQNWIQILTSWEWE